MSDSGISWAICKSAPWHDHSTNSVKALKEDDAHHISFLHIYAGDAGMVMCLGQGAYLHMAQLMPAHPGSPRKIQDGHNTVVCVLFSCQILVSLYSHYLWSTANFSTYLLTFNQPWCQFLKSSCTCILQQAPLQIKKTTRFKKGLPSTNVNIC